MSVKEAVAEGRATRYRDDFQYTKLAEKHGVTRSTLTRQLNGECASKEEQAIKQRLMHPNDEAELVEYVRGLTERHLMPTRQMLKNFAAPIIGREPSDSWVTDFINRNSDTLITAWTTPMEKDRHKADSGEKYRLYFELLHRKMAQYNLEPAHTYNMDEKGFAIGVTGRSKRIFDKVLHSKKRFEQSLHDGNREWVTLLATICGDGSVLPPGIIYAAAGRAVQASWVASIDKKIHDVHFTTSPNGWTNSDLGLTWLEQVFERYTKGKARRKWRLLIIDGHGSHVTKDFIDYCDKHKILLLVFPPHATHTLQPLDVVCFKPLAGNYTKELDLRTQKTQGWLPVTKGDFFPLFWKAWTSTFTKELVEKAFSATGIFPPNASVILDKFATTTPERAATPPHQTAPAAVVGEPPWLKAKTLLRAAMVENDEAAGRELMQYIHHLSVQNQLLEHQLQGAKEALTERGQMKSKQKVLPLYAHTLEWHGGARWWSPTSKAEADARDAAYEAYAAEQEAAKATERELKKTEKLLKDKRDEQARVRRAREKDEREKARIQERKEIDARKAERARLKEQKDREKASRTTQKGKRKLPQQQGVKKKQNRGDAAARSGVVAHKPPSAPPPTHNSRGRKILQPRRYW